MVANACYAHILLLAWTPPSPNNPALDDRTPFEIKVADHNLLDPPAHLEGDKGIDERWWTRVAWTS